MERTLQNRDTDGEYETMRRYEVSEMLNHVRISTCTDADLKVLKSHEISPVHPQCPHNALHVFTRNQNVDEYNLEHLRDLHVPITDIACRDYTKDRNTGSSH